MKIIRYSLDMDERLRMALISLLTEEGIVSSWGITNISFRESSLQFDVAGFLYSGSINITCENSYYVIHFDDGNMIQCNEKNLVNALDVAIERNDNYLQELETWILSQN